jgi:hypothetical protein
MAEPRSSRNRRGGPGGVGGDVGGGLEFGNASTLSFLASRTSDVKSHPACPTTSTQIVTVRLKRDQVLRAESGAMMYMTQGV